MLDCSLMPKTKSKRKKGRGQGTPAKRERREIALRGVGGDMSKSSRAEATSDQHAKKDPLAVTRETRDLALILPGISDRMIGFFQVAAVSPFFVASWVNNGLLIQDFFLFTLFFGALVIGTFAQSVHERRAHLPFPEQLLLFCSASCVIVPFVAYAETRDILPSLLLAGVATLRLFAAQIDPKSPASFGLLACAVVLGSSASACLGAYVASRELYLPYLIFGFVPGMMLASALVIQYLPMFEKSGWRRSQMVLKKDGTEVIRPAGISRLFILLLIGGPLLPALLVPFQYLASSFALPVLSLSRVPNVAEDLLKAPQVEAKHFYQVILLAILSQILLLIAAYV